MNVPYLPSDQFADLQNFAKKERRRKALLLLFGIVALFILARKG